MKRRANSWILMNSTERADVDLGTVKTGGDNEGDEGGQDGGTRQET